MPADMLIYSLREPKPPFQSWNEPLINKVKTSEGVVCTYVWVCVKSRLMNNVWIISFCGNERISVQQKKPRNISCARIRSDTASLERASSYRQICFAGFCVRMNQQHFLFSAHHHKDRGNGSKVNEGHLISGPVSSRVLHWKKPNNQSEITPNIQP